MKHEMKDLAHGEDHMTRFTANANIIQENPHAATTAMNVQNIVDAWLKHLTK